MSNSINQHEWYGLVSSYKKEFQRQNGDRINLTAGIDLRYYIGKHRNEIVDLYDGEYFIDYNTRKGVNALLNSAAADPMWKYQKLGVGDVVYRNYKGYARQEGAYAQGEYTMMDGKFNFVLAGSINNTAYWRREFLYADKEHERSQTVNFWGGTIKGGAQLQHQQVQQRVLQRRLHKPRTVLPAGRVPAVPRVQRHQRERCQREDRLV